MKPSHQSPENVLTIGYTKKICNGVDLREYHIGDMLSEITRCKKQDIPDVQLCTKMRITSK